jgi:hypothetical protein
MMKKAIVFVMALSMQILAFGGSFQDFFGSGTCRIDFHLTGDARETKIALAGISREPFWGGPHSVDGRFMNLGDYRFEVTDSLSGKLIYSDGFNALFREWQTTPEALRLYKSFEQTIVFPFPLKTVQVKIQQRKSLDDWDNLTSFYVDPADKLIRLSSPQNIPVKVLKKNQPAENAVDIAIIAEGYTAREKSKFYKDAETLMQNISAHEPFKKHAAKLNFYAIAAASEVSGVSVPHEDKWVNSAVHSNYYTFYSERYLTSSQVFRVRDLAATVPYDAIYILVNTTSYGGGGIYNYYALTAARGRKAAEVTVHEFGHSFAGLGDEYFYDNTDALDNTYSTDQEPWEPNITTLVNFDRKWKSMLPVSTPFPTPMPADSISRRSTTLTGVYEGAGYKAKGIYRPTPDCRMKTNEAPQFCPVCEKAVEERIKFLTFN